MDPARDVSADLHIAIVTDGAYAPWCATTMASAAEATADRPASFHIIHTPDLDTDHRDRLVVVAESRGADVAFHLLDEERLATLPSKGADLGGRVSWARIALADALPGLERVVYLDADTLVTASLAPLGVLDLQGAPVAAVRNVTEPEMQPRLYELGVAPEDYFNAGVLVVDLQQWRAEDAGRGLVELVRRHRDLVWFDQDALNSLFAGRWLPLSPRWNAMNSLWTWPDLAVEAFGEHDVSEATTNPAVLHFEGPGLAKPWHFLCEHPWREHYRAVLARTPWAGTPLSDQTLATRLIARLPRRYRVEAFARLLRSRTRRKRMRRILHLRTDAE
jgi:lipopolysaccharide biosynthesis glycosyltransferase